MWPALFGAVERSSSRRAEGDPWSWQPGRWRFQQEQCQRVVGTEARLQGFEDRVRKQVQQLWIKSPLLCVVCLCLEHEAGSQLSRVTE